MNMCEFDSTGDGDVKIMALITTWVKSVRELLPGSGDDLGPGASTAGILRAKDLDGSPSVCQEAGTSAVSACTMYVSVKQNCGRGTYVDHDDSRCRETFLSSEGAKPGPTKLTN